VHDDDDDDNEWRSCKSGLKQLGFEYYCLWVSAWPAAT
jgi:hypothetical protein